MANQKKHQKPRGGFDYAKLEAGIADEMRSAAERVRGLLRDSVVTVGRELLAIKKKIEHGQFMAWVRRECRLNLRTVQRYTQAAELVEKDDKLSYLPADGLLALSSRAAKPIAEQIIKRIGQGEKPTAADIKREIAAAAKGTNRPPRSRASLDEIQNAVKTLDSGQLAEFVAWFDRYYEEQQSERGQAEGTRPDPIAAEEFKRHDDDRVTKGTQAVAAAAASAQELECVEAASSSSLPLDDYEVSVPCGSPQGQCHYGSCAQKGYCVAVPQPRPADVISEVAHA
jgi:hypothetical protein